MISNLYNDSSIRSKDESPVLEFSNVTFCRRNFSEIDVTVSTAPMSVSTILLLMNVELINEYSTNLSDLINVPYEVQFSTLRYD